MNNKDLVKLGFDVGDYDIKSLFNKTNVKSHDYCLNRIKCILQIYSSWITLNQQQKQQSSDSNILSIYDLINSLLSPFYNFNKFLQDFNYLMTHRQLLGYDNHDENDDSSARDQDIATYQSQVYGNDALLLSQKDEAKSSITKEEGICDASCCFIEERHGRKKEYFTRFSNEVNALFFVNDSKDKSDGTSSEADTRFVAAQQMLDAVHSFVFHSMRIDMDRLIKNNVKTSSDSQDFNQLCHDFVAKELTATIRRINSGSKRFRAVDRDGTAVSKFVSTNEYKSCFVEEEQDVDLKVDENDAKSHEEVVCFIDGLCDELIKHGIAYSTVRFGSALIVEEYDTDAFCDDYGETTAGSNVRDFMYSCSKNDREAGLMNEICDNYFRIYINAHEEYSAGYRYFYWDFYKHNQDTGNIIFKHPSGQQLVEFNDGYRLCDWYIPAKYETFKEEITDNDTAPFSIRDWEETKQKAAVKLDAWSECDDARNLIVGDSVPGHHKNKWEKVYGIADGTIITIYHIMSLLFYCNYTAQSYEFSATFRRIFWNETDRSLKRRHSKLAQWGRLLRECVDCWGYLMAGALDDDPGIYFHGIGKEMLFKSTNFKVFGPMSTTTGLS